LSNLVSDYVTGNDGTGRGMHDPAKSVLVMR